MSEIFTVTTLLAYYISEFIHYILFVSCLLFRFGKALFFAQQNESSKRKGGTDKVERHKPRSNWITI